MSAILVTLNGVMQRRFIIAPTITVEPNAGKFDVIVAGLLDKEAYLGVSRIFCEYQGDGIVLHLLRDEPLP